MIAKVVHGYRPAGLLAYLFGPGKFEEHRNPRVVASWDAAPWIHHPPKLPGAKLDGELLEPGEFDFDLRPLTATMQELAEHAGLPLSNPPGVTAEWAEHLRSGRRLPDDAPSWVRHYKYDRKKRVVVLRQGYVWHCPVRLHADDPILSDEQWERIAERLMTATEIHQAGCRWIAVRHADDHIHLMATLVSEHTGKRFTPYRDYRALRKECRAIESEMGLTPTPDADWTAQRTPTRKERGKAERRERPVAAREELRRVVMQCAASVQDGEEFLAALRAEGLITTTSHHADGRIRGYSVALPGDVTAAGKPVPYAGGSLGSDLTWPKLEARWSSTPPVEAMARTEDDRVVPADRRAALEHATEVVQRAATTLAESGQDAEGIAHAVGEVLSVLARGVEGREPGPYTAIADQYDRAARTPHRVLPNHTGLLARDLRRASRRIAAVGSLTGRGKEKLALLALVLALASLIAEIAAWQQQRGRVHQAAAARKAAGVLPGLARPTASGRRPAARPVAPSTAGGARRERPASRRGAVARGRPPSQGQGKGPG